MRHVLVLAELGSFARAASVLHLSQSALSQHLAKLRADGLVEFRRAAQTLHYRVVDPRALRVLQLLKEIYCGDLR